MSEIAMTVVAGRSNRNSGDLRSADVLGCLYVGGGGMWRFTLIHQDVHAHVENQVVMLDSQQNLMAEMRAGIALALGLGEAREMAVKIAGSDWANKRLEFSEADLERIGNESRNREIALLVTSVDEALTQKLIPNVNQAGWSTQLSMVSSKYVETQWDNA